MLLIRNSNGVLGLDYRTYLSRSVSPRGAPVKNVSKVLHVPIYSDPARNPFSPSAVEGLASFVSPARGNLCFGSVFGGWPSKFITGESQGRGACRALCGAQNSQGDDFEHVDDRQHALGSRPQLNQCAPSFEPDDPTASLDMLLASDPVNFVGDSSILRC